MIPAPFRVVLDANVLYPFTLRDTLLRSAADGLFQPYWSKDILDETTRNLIKNLNLTEQKAAHLITQMSKAFPEALVIGFEDLITSMRNDQKDRHVVAAAVKAGAQVIVTANLRDFRDLPDGIEAQSPDEFLCNVFDLDPDGMVRRVQRQAADLRKPPRTFDDVVRALTKHAPDFGHLLREHFEQSRD